ncbi:MAG TPA: response regulator [Desulfovibrio sp.]|jgi:two-component system chemotaxis response regulator CheY|uniref:response regulator n=1 Tax=Desulfovibrio TaxID=872 RepID=UPI0004803902|nr:MULTISPECIES: response regulator [Desulfovibrio]MDY0307348.1 response regulator [Desulfovibrionaceae bacterium]HMM38236.1 response regulator [Desulfovibrio sp.]
MSRPRVLIVEDNAVNREFLLAVLSRHGECATAPSGEDALELFQRTLLEGTPFDLVFMDVLLPGMDGLQALERIRDLERSAGRVEGNGAKVVVATALDDDQYAARAFSQDQAVSFIAKPLSVDRILSGLRRFGFLD